MLSRIILDRLISNKDLILILLRFTTILLKVIEILKETMAHLSPTMVLLLFLLIMEVMDKEYNQDRKFKMKRTIGIQDMEITHLTHITIR